MNPWGLMFIALGFLMIVVGFKGSQHNVMKAFKGTKGGVAKKNIPAPKGYPGPTEVNPPKLM